MYYFVTYVVKNILVEIYFISIIETSLKELQSLMATMALRKQAQITNMADNVLRFFVRCSVAN